MQRISGPLLDRIDIHVEVPAVAYDKLAGQAGGESSDVIRSRVQAARELQTTRFKNQNHLFCNADMQPREIRKFCKIDAEGSKLLRAAIERLGLSARAYDRILKVSRTIADLAASEKILPDHVGEAIQYRGLDREVKG